MKFMHMIIVVAIAIFAVSAQAVEVSSLPGSVTYNIPSLNLFTAGPENIAPGITWSSTTSDSVFGWTGLYRFSNNGNWNDLSMIGSNTLTDTMTISFASPVKGVAAFMNYATSSGSTPLGSTPTIAVFNSGNQLLESSTLSFSTSGLTNTGEVHGFLENTADISSMTLSGSFIGAAALQVVAVPEPETYAMMIAGLGLMGFMVRRKKTA